MVFDIFFIKLLCEKKITVLTSKQVFLRTGSKPNYSIGSGPAEPVRLVWPWPDQLLNLVALFFKNLSQNCKLLRIKSVYNKNATSSDRKIATAALNLRTWNSDT